MHSPSFFFPNIYISLKSRAQCLDECSHANNSKHHACQKMCHWEHTTVSAYSQKNGGCLISLVPGRARELGDCAETHCFLKFKFPPWAGAPWKPGKSPVNVLPITSPNIPSVLVYVLAAFLVAETNSLCPQLKEGEVDFGSVVIWLQGRNGRVKGLGEEGQLLMLVAASEQSEREKPGPHCALSGPFLSQEPISNHSLPFNSESATAPHDLITLQAHESLGSHFILKP